MNNFPISYSRGATKFDNSPEQLSVATFDDFEKAVLSDRSPEKGMAYVCAPLSRGKHYQKPNQFIGINSWRLKDYVKDRSFISFDCDGFGAPKNFHELLKLAGQYRGFGYTTASHTDQFPRARLIFLASRPLNRPECISVCISLQTAILKELGNGSVLFDESVYRGEQPLYTPVETSQIFHFNGAPVDVDELINKPAQVIYKLESKQGSALLSALAVTTSFEPPARVSDGKGRELTILKYAGSLRAQGLSQTDIDRICLDYNQLHIIPPLDAQTVLDRAQRYQLDEAIKTALDFDWRVPEEIKNDLPPVPEFDEALLPSVFRVWVADIAERMQCPIEFLAVGALVAAGAAIGNRIGIQPKRHDTGWVEVPNLWGAVVGRPGVMKSPALAQVLAPLRRIEAELQDDFVATKSQYEINRMIYEVTKKQISAQMSKGGGAWSGVLPVEPEIPQPQRKILNDATYQKLGQVLSGNPHGVLVFQDELSGMLKRLDSEGQEAARAFYLEAWDGKQSYTFDRLERGTIKIPRLCFSLLGGLQPTKLREYLRSAMLGGAGDDGLAQRFQLLVYPDIKREWVQIDRAPNVEVSHKVDQIFDQISKLDPISIGAVSRYLGAVPVLRFDEDAQYLFNKWWALLENNLRQGEKHPALESHLSKYRKLVPALALLDHLISGNSGDVGVDSFKRALRWHNFLFAHAERAYAGVTASNYECARCLLRHIKKGDLSDGFTIRDVYRKGWALLSNAKDATEAVDVLLDFGWLRSVRDDKKTISEGRSTVRYFINPCIREVA